MSSNPEPFPNLHAAHTTTSSPPPPPSGGAPLRRKSTTIGELRHGDTGPAMATSRLSMSAVDGDDGGASPLTTTTTTSSSPGAPGRVSKRRRARRLLSSVRRVVLRHTWLLPAFVLVVLGLLYLANPTKTNPIRHFIFLSYPVDPPPGTPPDAQPYYTKGRWDIAFVLFYTVFLSFAREFITQELLRPLALWFGLRSRTKRARFMEQMYTLIYFGCLGPAGLWVMRRTPVWYFNTRGMYEDYPHLNLEAGFKFYYLFQAAYWSQQAIVLLLRLEKARKDFRELVAHHIVTLVLIGLSYHFHFTHIGISVYTTHDISDFFLAGSKTLKYIDSPLVAPVYFVFLVVWIYMRHYLNLQILWSIVGPEYATVGPYVLDWTNQQYKSPPARFISAFLLSCLQFLNLFWLFYILRIAYRFLRDHDASDDRSEGEAEADDEDVPTATATTTTPVVTTSADKDSSGDGKELRHRKGSSTTVEKRIKHPNMSPE